MFSIQRNDLVNLLKSRPFEPFRLALSDGRSVVIRHPDQAVVTRRKLLVGIVKVERSRPAVTPRTGDEAVNDWMMLDLMHIIAAEPSGGSPNGRGRRRKRRG